MSRLIARLLLSMLLIPVGGLVYMVVAVPLVSRGRVNDTTGFMIANLVTWTVVSVYWIVLWRSSIRWTTPRVVMTIASFAATGVVGLIVALAVAGATGGMDDFHVFLAGVIAMVLWLVATVIIWHETKLERLDRLRARGMDAIVCPVCGYNMTGLHETTCPECGGSFTLEQILAEQSGAAGFGE